MFKLKRIPTHPGEILKEEFLKPLGISQTQLAKALHISFRAINELVNEKRGVSIEMALKLSRYFKTTPEFWLNLQNKYDLYKINIKKRKAIEEIKSCDLIAS